MPALARAGHSVLRAVRGRAAGPTEARWDPATGEVDLTGELDGVVHLAGASLARRWTARTRREAWESRVGPTRALALHLSVRAKPPAMIHASAIGIYGDRGEEPLDESSPRGSGFLADLAEAWEAASQPLAAAGGRVAHLRLGLVLTRRGGALAPMLLPFRLGLGGPLGSGRQYWSWVGMEDVLGAFGYALETPSVSGPVNVVGPEPVTQRRFAQTLGRLLHRPAVLPAPIFALRLAMGEMVDAMVLSSARVHPRALQASGFRFTRPSLEEALRAALRSGV